MLHGTIEVDRLMHWMHRQRSALEWIALKEYWRATDQDKPIVEALYGKVLTEALDNYRQRYST